MSALGHKRTSPSMAIEVCFTPETDVVGATGLRPPSATSRRDAELTSTSACLRSGRTPLVGFVSFVPRPTRPAGPKRTSLPADGASAPRAKVPRRQGALGSIQRHEPWDGNRHQVKPGDTALCPAT